MPKAAAAKPSGLGKKKRAKAWQRLILHEAESKLPFYAAIIASRVADIVIQQEVERVVQAHPELGAPSTPTSEYVSWAMSVFGLSDLPALQRAMVARKEVRSSARQTQRAVVQNVFILQYPTARAAWHNGVMKLWLNPLPNGEEYPPRNHWVASTQGIYDTWKPYLANCDLEDKRKTRKPIHLLDPAKLQYSIPENLSCIVFDKSQDTTIPALCVFRKFCNMQSLLSYATGIVSKGAAARRNVRKEDTGTIFLAGFSGGSRSSPQFGITRNYESHQGDERADNEEIANILTYLWSRAKGVFPPEVINDFEDFYDGNNIPRFDPNWPASSTKFGTLKLVLEGEEYVWENVERAPGPVHNEHQGHKFAISWTNHRQGSQLAGGHFYLSSFGIEVKACEDTAWAWQPEIWHTTGLANFDPTFEVPALIDPYHNQQNIAFVTSNRIKTVWKSYKAKEGPLGMQRVQSALEEIVWAHDEESNVGANW